MGKKRRNTARTGDKAIYKSRNDDGTDNTKKWRGNGTDDDSMYNEVDQFHNERERDYIRLLDGQEGNGGGDDDHDDEEMRESKALTGRNESVLDLGVGGGDDSSSSSSSNDEDVNDYASSRDDEVATDRDDDDDASSSASSDSDNDGNDDDDDDDDGMEDMLQQQDPRNWGKKKSAYYHGDTADLEIGQEEEDAYLEEEAAKEIQASRYEDMDEADFILSGDEEEEDKKTETRQKGVMAASTGDTHEQIHTTRDPSKLSKQEARKLLKKQYPEVLPMVSFFSDIVKDLKDRTEVATKALFEGEAGTAKSVGATRQGQQYLLTKAMLQKSIALNSIMYLLLRSSTSGGDDGMSEIQAHPVMAQLKTFNSLLQKFEDQVGNKTEGLEEQLDNLVKAAALMNNGEDGDSSVDSVASDHDEEVNRVDAEAVKHDSSDNVGESNEEEEMKTSERTPVAAPKQQLDFQRTLNEARFGFRPAEARKPTNDARKLKDQSHFDDFGDLNEDEWPSSSTKKLVSTINTIEQRSDTARRKRRPAPMAEQLDNLDDETDSRLAQGIKMMEEELGKLDGGYSDEDSNSGTRRLRKTMTNPDNEGDETNDESMQFYNSVASKSNAKKSIKKGLYAVAPAFPKKDAEIEGERAISRAILKNRGLVAHKAKINRNPRVKKREQYRKALIRRKGAVREVRQDEGHRYGGEGTGIKSGVSRSRKLSSK